MSASSSDELLVGALCLVIVLPWIGWTIWRGIRNARLPIGRGYVDRAERPAPFYVLLTLYILAALLIAFIAVDLLFGLTT